MCVEPKMEDAQEESSSVRGRKRKWDEEKIQESRSEDQEPLAEEYIRLEPHVEIHIGPKKKAVQKESPQSPRKNESRMTQTKHQRKEKPKKRYSLCSVPNCPRRKDASVKDH